MGCLVNRARHGAGASQTTEGGHSHESHNAFGSNSPADYFSYRLWQWWRRKQQHPRQHDQNHTHARHSRSQHQQSLFQWLDNHQCGCRSERRRKEHHKQSEHFHCE